MHTDERLSMSTHSSSMTKSHQRQPSQQQERRQSSTAAPISAQMDESHWITSSMLEASVSIMLNVSGIQTHRRIPFHNSITHSATNIAGQTTHSHSTVESWTKSETSETTQPSPDLSISKLQQQRFYRWLETPSRPPQPSALQQQMQTSTEHQQRPSHGPMQPVHGTQRSPTTVHGTGSIAGLNSNLGDGSVSVSIITRDWFGNQQTVTSSGWTLNTTMVRTTFSLDTSHPDVNNVGNYVGDFVRFIATPPAGGSFTMTAQSEAGSIGGYSLTTKLHKNMDLRFQLPIQLTHQDNSGSTSQQRMHTDERRSMSTHSSSMTKSRQRQPSQQQERRQSSTAAPISVANGRISLDNLVDAGGVGVDYAECFWNTNTTSMPIPQPILDSAKYCRPNHIIHTQLSNRGPSRKHRKQHNHLRICRSPKLQQQRFCR